MCGPGFRRLGEWTGTKPAARHVLYRDGDLELCRCSWAFGPGHLRRPSPGSGIYCAAKVSQMQTPTARVGQGASVRRRPQMSVTVRHRPSGSKNVMRVTWRRGAAGLDPRCPPPVGREKTGNLGCHTSTASWIAWDEQSADLAREPSRYSRSVGQRRQRSRQAKRRRLPRCLPFRCWTRSSAPGLPS